MEEADDVCRVRVGDALCGIIFCRLHATHTARARGARYENINSANGAEDLGDAWEVGLRGGVSLDFDLGVGILEGFLCGGEDGLATLEDDDACDTGFGEGFGDGVANAGC